MVKIMNYLKAAWFGFISLPILLVVSQFIARELGLSEYGIVITLYKGAPMSINYIVRWLLLIENNALTGSNFYAVLLVWGLGWFIIMDWVRDYPAVVGGVVLTYLFYIIYLSIYHRYPLVLVFPVNFYPILIGIIAASLSFILRKRRGTITFFDRLSRTGVLVPKAYLVHVELPVRCSRCNTVVLSNAKYCWKCGVDLEKELYERGEMK